MFENNADPNLRDYKQKTAMHYLTDNKKITDEEFEKYVKLLIQYKADVNATDENLYTPLQAVICNGNINKAKILMKYR